MNDERSLRVALSSTRGRQPFGLNVMRGGLTGFAAISALVMFESISAPHVSIAAVAPAPIVNEPFPIKSLAEIPAAAISPVASANPVVETPIDLTVTPLNRPMIASYDERRSALTQTASLGDEIVDPPRDHKFVMVEARGADDERSIEIDQNAGLDASIASEAPISEPAEVVVAKAEHSWPADQADPDEIGMGDKADEILMAEALTEPKDFPPAPAAAVEPDLAGAEVAYLAEVSLSTTDAFDMTAGPGASFAALVEPRIDAPATPNLNVDPGASFAEPLDALTDAPHPRLPELKAPAVVAVLGAQPPMGFAELSEPNEVDIVYRNDRGREAARWSVMSDEDMDWRRFAVSPPANPNNLPVLAIIIDEIGAYGAPVEDVATLSPMVSVSVIPSTPDSSLIADQLRSSGREVLVHMPMETYADFKEGPRPILKKMSDEEVRDTARWHLSQFTGYVGVNNHLGSKVTRDQRVMGALMSEFATQGLMFVDSRTSTKSVAEKVAADLGVMATRNHRFIDNEISTGAIMRELSAAAAHARRYGAAVALGNPNPATVRAVKQWMEANDGKQVLVAPITHVASVINGSLEEVVAGN